MERSGRGTQPIGETLEYASRLKFDDWSSEQFKLYLDEMNELGANEDNEIIGEWRLRLTSFTFVYRSLRRSSHRNP